MTMRIEDDEAEKAFDCAVLAGCSPGLEGWRAGGLVGNDKKMGGCGGV